ncbi:MAG TPA: prefoldin subunit alpha [Candidatus Norongarragalinales archaeon]|jgi:prefoldin alpha subunit|nr:prefoldin subunit alpha [Candidatus Norongarragalinales archaeon]
MTNEEELRKIAFELQYLEAQAQDMQKQLQQVRLRLAENQAAIRGLENLAPNQDTLFPLGSGVMLKANTGKMDKVLVDVGAGVAVEKPIPQALEVLRERHAALENMGQQISNAMTESAQKMEQLQNKGMELEQSLKKK